MRSITGVLTIVQEERFQLLDDSGVSHHFQLDYRAAIDPEQLPGLLNKRVQVRYWDPGNFIGHAAGDVLLPEEA